MIRVALGLVVFLFGLCVGSFLNVVVYRLNHNLSPLKGRSFCPKCKKKIPWRDNIPLLSFALLRGKCRFCHSPISWQYPLVELSTGILTVLVVFHLTGVGVAASPLLRWLDGLLEGIIFHLLITYTLIVLFVSDLRYQTIPDEAVYPAMALVFAFHLRGGLTQWFRLGSVLMTAFGASLFFLVLVLATRGKGMGMGDVKLAGLMGLVLGYPKIIIALILAFLTGALVGVILVLVGKKRFEGQIPFGPFLTSATWLSLFWGQTIWQFYVEKLLLS